MDLSHWFEVHSGKVLSFDGGVRLPDEKKDAADLPIADFMDPQQEMVFSMLQHQGEPCEPVVREGERVLRDQLIGKPHGLGANIYSSCSGVVKKIEPRLHPNGQMIVSVIIENDHQYETLPARFSPASYKELDKEEILRRIEYAGIVGMGGDGYPTHQKLALALERPIDTVLLNGCECEPYLSSDYRVMLEDSWRVINGLRITLSLFSGAKGIIVAQDNKPEAIRSLKEHLEGDDNIRIYPMRAKYPSGDEKMLIEAALKRQIPAGGMALDADCVTLNIDTSVAISRAVTQARPLERRIVTIAGDCVKKPQNYRMRIGTSFNELIEHIGPMTKRPRRIIYGGPMMGQIVQSLDFPVTKTSSCILLLSSKQTPQLDENSCIRCGQCLMVCPIHLEPYKLYEAVRKGNFKLYDKLNGSLCTSCGCCSYICPARRDLTKTIAGGMEVES
ncbi:MAG: electron transport complex subunit RsxC [Firmicutes bacterium]|nr:electron transport complex subunit RsxC [Bacillota bacterium]